MLSCSTRDAVICHHYKRYLCCWVHANLSTCMGIYLLSSMCVQWVPYRYSTSIRLPARDVVIEQTVLNVEKLVFLKELHCHLDEAVTRNLQIRCSPFVHQVIGLISDEVEGNEAASDMNSVACCCCCFLYLVAPLPGMFLHWFSLLLYFPKSGTCSRP